MEQATIERVVYTVEEAGKALGLSRSSAYGAVRSGQMPTIRIGRRLLVPKVALEKLLASVEPKVEAGQGKKGPNNGH